MLTVKHIENDGSESIVAASSVRTIKNYDVVFGDRIELLDDAELPLRIFSGAIHSGGVSPTYCSQIFVMNENGTTVASYRYSSQPPEREPEDPDARTTVSAGRSE